MMMLSGKRAMVFAADERLAETVARHLARLGAQVWVSGLDTEAVEALAEKIRADGGDAHPATVDPTDQYHVREYVDAVASKGPVDVVFNGFEVPGHAAGVGVPYRDLDPSVLASALSEVVGSQFLTAREAARVMVAAGRGSIVTLASTDGHSGRPHTGALGATAGAVEALARCLAHEYGPSGVRVNHVRATRLSATGQMYHENALGRPVTVDEVAAAVAWLASDAAGGVTGQVVEVSGGEHGLSESVAARRARRERHVELDLP
jgi:NAD(P)-dependent dehydrogenase (short-subunit alcohol dehydrogenase family)